MVADVGSPSRNSRARSASRRSVLSRRTRDLARRRDQARERRRCGSPIRRGRLVSSSRVPAQVRGRRCACRASSRKRHGIWSVRGRMRRADAGAAPALEAAAAHGLLCPRSAWTREHDRWLHGLRSNGCLRSASTSYGGVLEAKARRDRLDHMIAEVAAAPPYREIVARLSCLRGVSTLTALALTVELGDWQRFDPARLGAILGLVPSEQSSGEQRRQGRSTRPATATPARCSSKSPGTNGGAAAEPRPRRPPRQPVRTGALRGRSDRAQAARPLVGSRTARQAPHDRRGRRRVRARPAIAGSWSTRYSAVNSEADGRGCRVVACSCSG